jgi:hypothetical protein
MKKFIQKTFLRGGGGDGGRGGGMKNLEKEAKA